MARYFHSYPHLPKKHNYSKLFNDEDKAKLMYNRDMAFRSFVDSAPNMSLANLYTIYKGGAVQLQLF